MASRKGYVEYQRPTHLNTRTITEAEWRMAGVDDQPSLFWGPSNNWRVPAGDISDAAWGHIVNDPGLLHVVPEEEANTDDGAPVQEQEVRGAGKSKRQPRNG